MNLLSDAAQSQTWPTIAPLITKGKTLYFSHGFSVVYKEDTKVIPPKDVDVILVAPKGSGRTVRTLFKEGRGINSSVAVFQDVTGKAMEKAVAIGVAVGSGYMYETTFEKEVYSDLYGERGVLMGAIRKYPHTTSYSQLMIYRAQRVCSARSTRCFVPTATLLRKPSMKPSRRPLNPCTP
jgi:ketol-acid reductoisomerase